MKFPHSMREIRGDEWIARRCRTGVVRGGRRRGSFEGTAEERPGPQAPVFFDPERLATVRNDEEPGRLSLPTQIGSRTKGEDRKKDDDTMGRPSLSRGGTCAGFGMGGVPGPSVEGPDQIMPLKSQEDAKGRQRRQRTGPAPRQFPFFAFFSIFAATLFPVEASSVSPAENRVTNPRDCFWGGHEGRDWM
jgi:hypothetical protein